MIYTVTLNPSLDYLVRTDLVRLGSLNRTCGETLRPGGKGVNVSIVLAALGVPTRALGFIAGHTGALFTSLLAETGVEHDFCRLSEGMTRINMKISAREQTEINGAGPAIAAEAMDRLMDDLEALGPDDWLVLSGSVPAGVPADIYAQMLRRVAPRGVRTLVDTSGDALKNVLPYGPSMMKPNREELDELVRGAPRRLSELADCVRGLQQAGAQDVLLSLGAEGAMLVRAGDAPLYLSAPEGKVVQTVGAGDSMAAGWLYAQTRGLSAAESLRTAVAAGTAAACCGWLPGREEIERVLARTAAPREV